MVAASPSSYPARFTLCRVYRLLGAPVLYAPHLKKLSLSEIQLDNLMHVVSERGALEAHAVGISLWQELADRATDMYGRSVTDVSYEKCVGTDSSCQTTSSRRCSTRRTPRCMGCGH